MEEQEPLSADPERPDDEPREEDLPDKPQIEIPDMEDLVADIDDEGIPVADDDYFDEDEAAEDATIDDEENDGG